MSIMSYYVQIKTYSKYSNLFQVLALVGFRMLMDYWPLNMVFNQDDLHWLDSLMPGAKKKRREELLRKNTKSETNFGFVDVAEVDEVNKQKKT